MILNLRQLLYLTTLAETHSYHLAADRLFITQPTLSIAIKKLEDHLGFPLFNRSGKEVELTKAGELVFDYARKILSLDNELEKKLKGFHNQTKEELRVGTYAMLYFLLLDNFLSEVNPSQLPFKLKLQHGHNEELRKGLREGQYDAILCIQDKPEPGIKTKLLKREAMLLVIPETHPACQKAISIPGQRFPYLPIHELENEQFIIQQPAQQLRWQEDKLLHSGKIKNFSTLEIDSTPNAMHLVSGGTGIGFLMESYVESFSHLKNLRFFLTDTSKNVPWLMFSYLPNQKKNLQIQLLLRLLEASIKKSAN
jgi:DNA-binding transcriptional LysR family regulator